MNTNIRTSTSTPTNIRTQTRRSTSILTGTSTSTPTRTSTSTLMNTPREKQNTSIRMPRSRTTDTNTSTVATRKKSTTTGTERGTHLAAAALAVLLAAAAGCGTGSVGVGVAGQGTGPGPRGAGAPSGEPWVWQGERTIDSWVEIPAGATLTILPGSVLRFAFLDKDGDGVGEAGLHVLGRIEAVGTPAQPIVFTSAEMDPQPGDWQGFIFDNSKGSVFSDCVVEYAYHGFHAHFSSGVITRSRIERNLEGTRLGNSSFEISHNLVRGNTSKGINFFGCSNRIHHNLITGNADGIFLFETDTNSVIEANNIFGNERYDFRLGDFYRGGKVLRGNWWGTTDLAAIRAHVFDGEDISGPGLLDIDPAPAPFTTGWEGR